MQNNLEYKKNIVNDFFNNGILISPDILNLEDNLQEVFEKKELILNEKFKNFIIINNDSLNLFKLDKDEVNWFEIDRLKVMQEKKNITKPYESMVKFLLKEKDKINDETSSNLYPLEVISSYEKEIKKKSIDNFIHYFNHRYKELEKMLSLRQELTNLTSISRIKSKKDKENVALIAMVYEKTITSNNNIILKVEDLTGQVNVLVSKNNPDVFEIAKDIVDDEVIAITGVCGDNIVFSNNVIFPDIPLTKEIKKHPEEIYAVFLSDLHIGSNTFMEKEFNKFIEWINGKAGNCEQKELTDKIKYIFIAGDLVDGVGIYPKQEEELVIEDIYEQYSECARLLSKIPKDIRIILCPGNHDATRLSEPQPALFKDFTKPITKMSNVTMLSNPCVVNFAATKNFSGFEVLMYHGYCFDYFIANVDSIRNNGGYDRADLVMKFLLQRRHLAPSHKSTLYVPDDELDPLVIKKVPDFFVCGHIHKVAVSTYRNVSLICGSCWQSITSFQKKMGHHPEPAMVPIVNLQTRETKILEF
ncbi:MAG: DNA-directed DNA polymerase II small subunit [Nanoarchaeota archaeon]